MDNIEAEVLKHSEHFKIVDKRLDKLEELSEGVNKIALSVQRIADNQSAMLEQQKDLKKDVDEIKSQPAKDAHSLKMTVITIIVTAVVSTVIGALLALIIKGGM
jgi:hypothetical protein